MTTDKKEPSLLEQAKAILGDREGEEADQLLKAHARGGRVMLRGIFALALAAALAGGAVAAEQEKGYKHLGFRSVSPKYSSDVRLYESNPRPHVYCYMFEYINSISCVYAPPVEGKR